MSKFHGRPRLTAGEALLQGQRIRLGPNKTALLATDTDPGMGFVWENDLAVGDEVNSLPWTFESTVRARAAGAFLESAPLYLAASGLVDDVQANAGDPVIGYAVEASTGAGDVVEVQLIPPVTRNS
ncbi:MAG: hypothetical protein AAGB51_06220 [Planctomycetota bacterium]